MVQNLKATTALVKPTNDDFLPLPTIPQEVPGWVITTPRIHMYPFTPIAYEEFSRVSCCCLCLGRAAAHIVPLSRSYRLNGSVV